MPLHATRSRRATIIGAALVGATLLVPGTVDAAPDDFFTPVATFDVIAGNGSAVAEIVDVTADATVLAYTDGVDGEIGFVDITDPAAPIGTGTLAVGGEPTSLVVRDGLALVAVNTSPDFVNPSGELVVVDMATRSIVRTIELGGQPDSIALAPDGDRIAIVIENERDEDLNDGLIPQNDTGAMLIADVSGDVDTWAVSPADLTAVAAAAFAGSDLEPEYVDVNDADLAAVTFQENNHLAVVDLATGATVSQFSAGSVELTDVDTVEDDVISLDSTITRRREPDAVTWIDDDSFATANEGDYEDAEGEEGGSRGFTVFNVDGTVEYESGSSFEHLLVSVGHYPEGRSENKGVEPESVEFGTFDGRDLVFIGSERGNAVGVFDLGSDTPEFVQALPTGIGPEGLKAIPGRDLFVASTESDEAADGIPTMINIYRRDADTAPYPTIISETDPATGTPIPWVALSGLAGDPIDPATLYAVSDSFLASGYVYEVDPTATPARITDRIAVTGASQPLDLEGIAVAHDASLWLASEGRDDGTLDNLIIEADPSGNVVREIGLPAEFDDIRSNGFEGIAVTSDDAGAATDVYVAIQRAWPDEGDTDGVNTKIGRYSIATGDWSFVHYPLEAEGDGGWIGLSELTLLPDGGFAVIERDKGWGPSTPPNARLKSVYRVDLATAPFAPYQDGAADAGLTTIDKQLLVDVLPVLEDRSIFTAEKLEGFAVSADSGLFAVTDNDGVDGATGETLFVGLGVYPLEPDPEIPEAPFVVLMSLSAIALVGGTLVLGRRRMPAV